jgi:hypothetical protein
MKSGLKKVLAQVGVAAVLAVPMSAAVNLVGANAAEALTVYTYPGTKCSGPNLYKYTIYRYDYNWVEETFQGKRDYTVGAWGPLVQYNAPQCTGIIRPV